MPRSSAPTVRAALDLAGTMPGVTETRPGPDPDAALTGLAPDAEAGAGDVGWIAERALTADPDRPARFGGALLVVPTGTEAFPPCAVVVAEAPRLVFSRLAAALFPAPDAPHSGLATVAASARVAESARLAPGVVVGEGVEIRDDVVVGANAVLMHCTLEAGVRVGPGCVIGTDGFGYTRDEAGVLVPFPHVGRVVVEAGATLGANVCVDRGALGETRIGPRSRIDNLVHIAHNAQIGADVAVIANAMIAGGVTVGDRAWIAPSAAVLNQTAVGPDALVGLGAVVIRDVPAGATVAGNPARPL